LFLPLHFLNFLNRDLSFVSRTMKGPIIQPETARDATPECSDIEWPSTPKKFFLASFSLGLFIDWHGIYSTTIKSEEGEEHVIWSDREPDVPGREVGNAMEEDLRGDQMSADTMYVNLNELGDQCTDCRVFQP
jgi:hypothetical protein